MFILNCYYIIQDKYNWRMLWMSLSSSCHQFFCFVTLMWTYWRMIIMYRLMNSLTSLSSRTFLLHILQPPKVTSKSKTLINNISSNIFGPDSISGNVTVTVSDHLLQFVINIFSNSPSNIYERNWTNCDEEKFILGYLAERYKHV